MAVQFSLSYDDNGDPVLTENTVSGVRKVVSYAPIVSQYKPRFASIEKESDDVTMLSGAMEKKEVNENRLNEFINEMESNAAEDQNLSFIQKQDLERYTPTAIKKAAAGSAEMAKAIFSAISNVPIGIAGTVVKALDAILPDEDPEVKAMKEYYASDETSQLVESIPGMSNYNLVSGFGDSLNVGYARAAQKRQNTIDKTLSNKYGLTPAEIAQTKLGTYTGPVVTSLIDRNKNLQKLIDKENKERKRIEKIDFARQGANPAANITPQKKDYFKGVSPHSGNQGGDGFNTSRDAGPGYSGGGTSAEMGSF